MKRNLAAVGGEMRNDEQRVGGVEANADNIKMNRQLPSVSRAGSYC